METYDTIVIGGGFSGVAAARELTRVGRHVHLVEARDRLGGRTWYRDDALPGRTLELGGTWVHWMQPHVFSEATRYGLELVESHAAIEPERMMYIAGGARHDEAFDEVWPGIRDLLERSCEGTREVLDRPHDPFFGDVSRLDALTIQDRIDQLDLDREQRDILSAMWSLCASARCNEGGWLSVVKWYALAGFDVDTMFDTVVRYKFKHGTRSLIEAMAEDAGVELSLGTPVAAVHQDGDGVTVHGRNGETLRAATAIVTAPLNTLGSIEFAPELSELKRSAIGEGQASHGCKLWVHVKGDLPQEVAAFAPDDHLLNWLHTEVTLPDGQILVGFGNDGGAVDVTDIAAVAPLVRELLGDVEVVATTGHDWVGDEFSRGTWPVLRPNQVTRYLRALQEPEGRVVLAGSETSNGWNGFIDGAIESGVRAARQVHRILPSARPAVPALA